MTEMNVITLSPTTGAPVVSVEVEDARGIAMRMPHRQHVVEELRHDPRAESLLGGMLLNGHITTAQYQAGLRLRSTAARWLGMWLEDEEHEYEVERAIRMSYAAMHRRVLQAGGVRAVRIVWRTCVYNEPITSDELALLRRGINAMAGDLKSESA
jgi:hypothetical protein